MKMKFLIIGIFVSAIFSLIFLTKRINNPEDALLGEWKELSWDYEKLNSKQKLLGGIFDSKTDSIRIHSAESWSFKPNGVLILSKNGLDTTAQWSVKGRGNILEINDGKITERYDITLFKDNKIELNYLSEIQIKGAFGRLVFEKV